MRQTKLASSLINFWAHYNIVCLIRFDLIDSYSIYWQLTSTAEARLNVFRRPSIVTPVALQNLTKCRVIRFLLLLTGKPVLWFVTRRGAHVQCVKLHLNGKRTRPFVCPFVRWVRSLVLIASWPFLILVSKTQVYWTTMARRLLTCCIVDKIVVKDRKGSGLV